MKTAQWAVTLLVATTLLSGCAASQVRLSAACQQPDNLTHVTGKGECLVIKTFARAGKTQSPTLVVFIHGDGSSGGPSDYLYRRAERVAEPEVVSVALIRPGYYDREGNASTGDDNYRSDNYTEHNVRALAEAIKALKRHHGAKRLVLVGHSGGAAIAGIIIGLYPGLADAAVLAACPCDVPRWRGWRGRDWPNSLSPHDHAARVPRTTLVIALTGESDTNTFPELAQDYVALLAKDDVKARFVLVANADHNGVARAPEFYGAIEAVIRQQD